MKTEDALSKIEQVFREVFDDPKLEIREDTIPSDLPLWDSLTHIHLVMSLEEAFNIQFTSAEIITVNRVGDLVTAIRRHV